MRFIKIFLLHIQQTLQERSLMFVYFLISLINPFIYVLFWQGATAGGRSISPGWNFSAIASYYFYFTILNGLLMAHPEYDVSRKHIKEGELVMFLLKPIPYFLQVFFMEFSWRFVRFWFSIITVILFYIFWHNEIIGLHNSLIQWALIPIVLFLGFMVSFVMKMIMGIAAFWLTDTKGLYDLMEVIFILFAGFVVPLALFPGVLSSIVTTLPFAYVIYFPALVLQGKLPLEGVFQLIAVQIFWIGVLSLVYYLLWKNGIKKFTAAGQ